MSNFIGNCPYCDNGTIFYDTKDINGRKTKLYKCSNNKVTTEDGEVWEQTQDSSCSFKIFGNSLERYGKKFIGPKEVKKLIDGKDIIGYFYSFLKKTEYKKYITINQQYGASIIWDIDIEDDVA